MTKSNKSAQPIGTRINTAPPALKVSKLGIVARDYDFRYGNGYRDFSHRMAAILKMLDDNGCDTVLFSLFGIVPRKAFDTVLAFEGLKNIKAVLLEEFRDTQPKEAGRYVIYHRSSAEWMEYEFCQQFGTLTGLSQNEITDFVRNETPKRIMGNCCVLLCGETNGVKYSPHDKKVHDVFGLRRAVPDSVNVVLNPIHDRMTRFEMKLKRQFLSEKGRWVISVWNKGKKDKNGKVKDGYGPAWTAYYNGEEINIRPISNNLDVEIGMVNLAKT